MILKRFENFSPRLALPPHTPPPHDPNRFSDLNLKMTLKQFYELDNGDVKSIADRINNMRNVGGTYIRVSHMPTGIKLISQNEPCIITGISARGIITKIGSHKDIMVDDDSIIIYIKVDDSLFILPVNGDYEFEFVKPKVVISHHDPYGEEDWSEEE